MFLLCILYLTICKLFWVVKIYVSPEDDQSILIKMSSCNLQFLELITTQEIFHIVSPQISLIGIVRAKKKS